MEKLKTLQAIITGAGIDGIDVNGYDFTLPDDADESQAGGVWDLAGDIAESVLIEIYETDADVIPDNMLYGVKEKIQSLLYNLMCDYKKGRGEPITDKSDLLEKVDELDGHIWDVEQNIMAKIPASPTKTDLFKEINQIDRLTSEIREIVEK